MPSTGAGWTAGSRSGYSAYSSCSPSPPWSVFGFGLAFARLSRRLLRRATSRIKDPDPRRRVGDVGCILFRPGR